MFIFNYVKNFLNATLIRCDYASGLALLLVGCKSAFVVYCAQASLMLRRVLPLTLPLNG